MVGMEDLLERIDKLLSEPSRDGALVERTLTDGYAHALTLEAEGRRLQSRLADVARSAQTGDPTAKTRELSQLAKRIDGTSVELSHLRTLLAQLKQQR
jgi:hypothetical protein